MFVVLLKGEGYGCDYTIGCNKTWRFLKAETMEEARKEVEKIAREYSEPGIEKATILQVAEKEDGDVAGWRKKWKAAREKKAKEAKEAADRAQYEALKKKFENS